MHTKIDPPTKTVFCHQPIVCVEAGDVIRWTENGTGRVRTHKVYQAEQRDGYVRVHLAHDMVTFRNDADVEFKHTVYANHSDYLGWWNR